MGLPLVGLSAALKAEWKVVSMAVAMVVATAIIQAAHVHQTSTCRL